MKILITLKDPDTLYDAVNEAIDEKESGRSEVIRDAMKEEIRELAADWFEYGEYVNLEFDTKRKTMKVLKVDEVNRD